MICVERSIERKKAYLIKSLFFIKMIISEPFNHMIASSFHIGSNVTDADLALLTVSGQACYEYALLIFLLLYTFLGIDDYYLIKIL